MLWAVLGMALRSVAPSGMPGELGARAAISGDGIPANATVALLPAAGERQPGGCKRWACIAAPLTIDAAAAPGVRSVVVRDGTGKVISFVGPAQSQVVFTAGQPTLASVEPLFGKPAASWS